MSAPQVSVVIPAYNRAAKIGPAVESVLEQDARDLEVIVVDDGSKDGTPDAVRALAARDGRVRLIELGRNRGAQAARNAGIRDARGEWIAFLDSDDTWLPGSLSGRLATAAEERAEVVHSGCRKINPDGSTVLYSDPIRGRAYKTVLSGPAPMFQGLLVKKAALEAIGLLDERVIAYQEWDTAIRLARRFAFAFHPRPTFVYDCRGTDTISVNDRRNGIAYETIVKKHLWDVFRLAGPGVLSKHFHAAADWYARAGDRHEETRCRAIARVFKSMDVPAILRKIKRTLVGAAAAPVPGSPSGGKA